MAETIIHSSLPRNCSLSLEKFYIGYSDSINYKAMLPKLSNILPMIFNNFSGLKTLDQALATITSSVKSSFVASLAFTALLVLVGLAIVVWKEYIYYL
jgi:hypothetical protein